MLRSLDILIDRLQEAKNTEMLPIVASLVCEIATGLAQKQRPGNKRPTPESAMQLITRANTLRAAGVAEKGVPLMREGIHAVDAVLSQSPPPIGGRERARFLNETGYMLGLIGDGLRDADLVHKAEQWLREAMRLMVEPDGSEFAGQLCDSLGFVLTLRAELEGDKAAAAEAKALLEQSVLILDQLKEDKQCQAVNEHLARLKLAL